MRTRCCSSGSWDDGLLNPWNTDFTQTWVEDTKLIKSTYIYVRICVCVCVCVCVYMNEYMHM